MFPLLLIASLTETAADRARVKIRRRMAERGETLHEAALAIVAEEARERVAAKLVERLFPDGV